VTGIATLLFDGNLVAIAIAILFTFGVPIALHRGHFDSVDSTDHPYLSAHHTFSFYKGLKGSRALEMSSQANWNSVTGIATLLFDGNLVAIAIAILFTFG
jgi:hypothetical protein